MSETLTTSVPAFETQAELQSAMQAKASFDHVDLYPRDGSGLQGAIEARIAELNGLEDGQALSYRSGMAATTAAIDVGRILSRKRYPTIVAAEETYSQTRRYFENFVNGTQAKVTNFDSGNPASLEDSLTRGDADVLFAEPVANYQNIPVLDVEHALDTCRQLGDDAPVFVIDNTAALSTGKPIGDLITEEDKVIVVESGTKSYTFNGPLLGVAYTKNPELLDALRRYRRTRGDVLGGEAELAVYPRLPKSREVFDERNKRLFKNSGELALSLYGGLLESNADDQFCIAHPAIPTHPNAALYKEQYPDGGAPFVYVSATFRSELTQHDLTQRLLASQDVRQQADFGQSFGFDQARIIYDENLNMVRIAGGANTDGQALGKACASALFKIS